MELDDIKHLAEKEQFGAITLDTSIFDSLGLKLESGLLKQLGQFRHRSTKFILSEIVENEVLSHLEREIKNSKIEIDKALNKARLNWQIEDEEIDKIKITIFKELEPKIVASKRFNDFIELTSIELVKVRNVMIGELIKRYFRSQPPFAETGKKKNEFPDAIALMSLESWAKGKNTKVLVVSKDNDWKNFCEVSEYLFIVDDLQKALELLASQSEDVYAICGRLSEKYIKGELNNIVDIIDSKIENLIDNFDFYPEAYSSFLPYEKNDLLVSYKGFEFQNFEDPNIIFRPIDLNDKILVIAAKIVINVSIECNFLFYVKDFVDNDYVSLGSDNLTKEISLDANILIKLVCDSEGFDEDLEVEDLEVSLSETCKDIDFGEVQPNWMHEDKNSEY